jgi:hypothetical protein
MIEILMSDVNGHLQKVTGLSHGAVIAITVIALAVLLAFYALRSIGIYVIAKKQEQKHAFLAFVPFVWLYIVCKLLGKVKFFNWTFSKVALLLCIVFSLAEILTLVSNGLIFYPLVGNVLIGNKTVYIVDNATTALANQPAMSSYPWVSNIIYDSSFVWPYSAQATISIDKALVIMNYFAMILDLASTIIIIFVYINFFKKYWPQHFIIASILSIFGLFAPFAFAVRKREPVDYNQYMRQRYQAFYGGYGNPYGRPYGNPYGARPQGEQPTAPEHPFEEFAERGEVDPGDPFDEFSNNPKPKGEPFDEFNDKK